MPSSVDSLLASQRLELSGVVRWGEPVLTKKHGVYLVALHSDPSAFDSCYAEAPISEREVESWLEYVPDFELNKMKSPKSSDIARRLKGFWLPDECVLYIGCTRRSLMRRVDEYYRTKLGEPRPHSGGHWIKTLDCLESLFVFYAECEA